MENKTFYLLGDKWIYFKLYLSKNIGDYILNQVIHPLCIKLIDKEAIKYWFFIRYFDDNYHIRVRLLVKEEQNINYILSEINKAIYKNVLEKIIWKIDYSIYTPELNRYGKNRMELTEKLFYFDSEIILNFINFENQNNLTPEIRWLFSIHYIDYILDSFKLSTYEKLDLFFNLKNLFEQEFKVNKISGRQINNKYREYREQIEKFVDNNYVWFQDLLIINEIERRHTIDEILNTFKQTNFDELKNYLSSIIHMTLNRMFPSENRFYELILYTFLHNIYKKDSFTKGKLTFE